MTSFGNKKYRFKISRTSTIRYEKFSRHDRVPLSPKAGGLNPTSAKKYLISNRWFILVLIFFLFLKACLYYHHFFTDFTAIFLCDG